jgi:hypothetical protein
LRQYWCFLDGALCGYGDTPRPRAADWATGTAQRRSLDVQELLPAPDHKSVHCGSIPTTGVSLLSIFDKLRLMIRVRPPISYLHWKYARGLWKYEWNIRNPPPPSSPSDDLEAGLSKSPPYILSRHSRAVNGAQLFFSTARESIFSRTRRSSFYPTESIHTLRTPLPTENQMSLPRTERPKPTHKSNLRLNKAKIGGPVQYVENTHWRI